MLAARARALSDQTEAAIARARHATELAPDTVAAYLLLGRIYQEDKQFKEAAAVWTEVLSRFPYEIGPALELAYCREQLGDVDGALEVVREAKAREPDNPTVLNFMGYLLADHNRNLEEARVLIGRALEQEPANGAFVDSMGWVYYRMGMLTDARHELERAVRLTGGDPVVQEHLGDVYKELRLIELAKEAYRKSLVGDRSNARVRTKLGETR
jgi:tetratricopeptide (TPR) repeat protein